jgi:hypothetical protein
MYSEYLFHKRWHDFILFGTPSIHEKNIILIQNLSKKYTTISISISSTPRTLYLFVILYFSLLYYHHSLIFHKRWHDFTLFGTPPIHKRISFWIQKLSIKVSFSFSGYNYISIYLVYHPRFQCTLYTFTII